MDQPEPPGASASWARGLYNGTEVGQATVGGVIRAGMWTGSATSWVSIHPAGATMSVPRTCMAMSRLVGRVWATIATLPYGVALRPRGWTSAPPVATDSFVEDVFSGQQVGVSYVGRSSCWSVVWNGLIMD